MHKTVIDRTVYPHLGIIDEVEVVVTDEIECSAELKEENNYVQQL